MLLVFGYDIHPHPHYVQVLCSCLLFPNVLVRMWFSMEQPQKWYSLTFCVCSCFFSVVVKFITQYISSFCRNSQMLSSATFFIPDKKPKILFCSSAVRIVFYCFFCCLFCLSVQLCGETFGPTWQFSEALARRDIDKNVNIGKRIHEGQGKGKLLAEDHQCPLFCCVCLFLLILVQSGESQSKHKSRCISYPIAFSILHAFQFSSSGVSPPSEEVPSVKPPLWMQRAGWNQIRWNQTHGCLMSFPFAVPWQHIAIQDTWLNIGAL